MFLGSKATMHSILRIAAELGHVTARFEPGTSFHDEVILPARRTLENARTRDDLEQVVEHLERKLTGHLTDEELVPFRHALDELKGTPGPWPVDDFKQSFLTGLGQELPEEGSASGRTFGSDKGNA
jgi:hypothetical protein